MTPIYPSPTDHAIDRIAEQTQELAHAIVNASSQAEVTWIWRAVRLRIQALQRVEDLALSWGEKDGR